MQYFFDKHYHQTNNNNIVSTGSCNICWQPCWRLFDGRLRKGYLIKKWIRVASNLIDLFSMYVLFSQYRSCDNTLDNCLFQISSHSRAYLRVIYEKTKGQRQVSLGPLLGEQNIQAREVYCAYSILFNSWNVGKFSWNWILKDSVSKFRKRIRSCCLEFPSSTKREIRQFHVAVVQRPLRNVTRCCEMLGRNKLVQTLQWHFFGSEAVWSWLAAVSTLLEQLNNHSFTGSNFSLPKENPATVECFKK